MEWPVNSTTDEGRVKWNIAVKFLIPTKYNVTRAINLYKTYEVRMKYGLFNVKTTNFCLESS